MGVKSGLDSPPLGEAGGVEGEGEGAVGEERGENRFSPSTLPSPTSLGVGGKNTTSSPLSVTSLPFFLPLLPKLRMDCMETGEL
ncbi:hypothetical protein EON63_20820 [archaeon]|nr:MAG: hypothetical protein EON63_20820 [archaeon]